MLKKQPLFTFKEIMLLLLLCFCAAASFYCFVTPNNFAPGGIYGLGSMIQNVTAKTQWAKDLGFKNGVPWAIPVIIMSIPLIIVSLIVLNKKSALVIMMTALFINGFDILLEVIHFPQYTAAGNNVMCLFGAAIGGIIAGVSFAITIKAFGTSDGTIAIAAILKKKRPNLNIPWTTFAFDIIVVAASFFVYWKDYTAAVRDSDIGVKIAAASVPIMYSVVYMFFVSRFCDMMLKGFSSAYKFEIVCTEPDEIAARLMEQLGRGVTVIQAEGMYTKTPKSLLICLVPKKQIAEFKKILRDFPGAFGYIMPSTEVMGDFR